MQDKQIQTYQGQDIREQVLEVGKSFERAAILSKFIDEKMWLRVEFQSEEGNSTANGLLPVIGRVFRIDRHAQSQLEVTAVNLLRGNCAVDNNSMCYMNRVIVSEAGEIFTFEEIILERELTGRVVDLTTDLLLEGSGFETQLSCLIENFFDDLLSAAPIRSCDPICLEIESLSSSRSRGL